jgi:hypothetical protein
VSVRAKTNNQKLKEKYMSLAYYEMNVGAEHSKSANAAQAETEGRYPMTVAAKKLGINVRAFRAGCAAAKYESDEWHHTGSHARRTDYYDTVVLVSNADFWRGAATCYSAIAAAKLLAKHNVSPLTDVELAAEKETAIAAALGNVTDFLTQYGERFTVQKLRDHGADWQAKGYKAQTEWENGLRYNSAMYRCGCFEGYDADSNWRRIHETREAAEVFAKNWAERHAKAFQGQTLNLSVLTLRVVTIREDICNDCALYGRVAGEFKSLGEAADYLK